MLSELRRVQQVDLFDVIRRVRRRWRLKILLRGGVVVLAAGFAAFLISTFGMDAFKFGVAAVWIFRILLYVVLVGLAWWFIVRPMRRRVTDEQVAMYIEEHEPSLQQALVSAVEMRDASRASHAAYSPGLTARLVEEAVRRCHDVHYGMRIEQQSIYRSTGTLAGVMVAGAVVALLSPGFVRHAAPFLVPFGGGTPANPYAIAVLPGDTLLARGADQLISATLRGFETDEVQLVARRGEREWERWPMLAGENAGTYELFLFDLESATEYYVEAAGIRSSAFRIDVAELPHVQQIDLEYHFPSYSGLEVRVEENGGDIAALQGTRVVVRVHSTIATGAGRLLVDGESPAPLAVDAASGVLTGSVSVDHAGYYRIELESANGQMVPASPDYSIEVLADQGPSVSFTKPGSDTKVTNIEEVFLEARAEDDFGIARLDLVYSVNGQPEDTVRLFSGGAVTKDMTAGHTLYLEELNLEPGDLVSYYATVWDNHRPGDGQSATTDIFFLEVRPFRRDYRQADQGGGGGGGGGGSLDGSLSAQQRDIVAATFKLVRDRDQYEDGAFAENLATLALAQGRIREHVEAIARRLVERGIIQSDSQFRKIVEELPLAAEQMLVAEEHFGKREADEALGPAQRALQHLQRADASFRDIQVAQGGGGGGGGRAAEAEDLADLFELELDKLRNQYETVQRGRQEQQDEEIDATLQKLRELARRQQQENERMRQRASQLQQGGQAGGGARNQRRLADEAEELARQLRRLSREHSSPEMEQTARRLQEAADAMRRAAANDRSGDLSEGLKALDQLREARRLMDDSRSSRLSRDISEAMDRANRLRQAQRDMVSDVESLSDDPTRRAEQLGRILDRKDQMAAEINDLEGQIDEMSRDARAEQPDAARKLDEAAGSIRSNRLTEKVRYSRGVVSSRSREYASNFEEQIQANIDELAERLGEAAGAVGESSEQRVARALDHTRDLVRDLESLQERIGERSEGQGDTAAAGTPNQQGRTGDQSAPQQGANPGEQQGQSQNAERGGQEGQRGQAGQAGQGRGQGQGGQAGSDQRSSDRASRDGNAAGGFAPNGSDRPYGGPITPGEARQFQREFRERRGDLEQLRGDLQAEELSTEALSQILRRLRDLEQLRDYNDPDEVRRLQSQVIEGLKEFEYALRRQLGMDEEERLILSGSGEVPRGFKELVEEYYRALGRSRNR